MFVLVAVALAACVPAGASPSSPRQSVKDLARQNPPQTVVSTLSGVVAGLRSVPADERRTALADAVSEASDGFDASGDRVIPHRDGVRAFVAEAAVVAKLHRRGAPSQDIEAVVGSLAAAKRTARVAFADVGRFLRGRHSDRDRSAAARAEVPERADDVGGLSDAMDRARTRGGCRERPHGARVAASRARAHLHRLDRALARERTVAAMFHAGLAWGHARSSLCHLGINPADPAADADRDGLPDPVELSLGTHPKKPDTDRDGLTDDFEASRLTGFSDPREGDTDGDGVRDDAEDADGDGLTNGDEQRRGTDPAAADVDSDRLDDPGELEAGTQPANPDTDGDTLLDGAELTLGLDPTAADTDGDGVRDDAETSTGDAAGPDGVTVRLTGTGDLPGAVQINAVPGTAAPGQVGPTYSIELPPEQAGALAQAVVDLPLAPPAEGRDPANQRIFTFDEATQRWVPVPGEQQVDVAGGRVRATVDDFSRFAVFDIVNWRQTWSTLGPSACVPGQTLSVDVAFMIDESGSMADNDPNSLRLEAAKSFVGALAAGDRASVSSFAGTVIDRVGLTDDKAALTAAIDAIPNTGTDGTNLPAAVSRATAILTGSPPDRGRVAILLTDGQSTFGYDTALNQAAADADITFYTIGLGSAVDVGLLQGLATATSGAYYPVSSADDLPEVLRNIGECVGDPGGPGGPGGPDPCAGQSQDGDSDRLPDCVETTGFLTGWGARLTTDPANPDTDGDQLPDGQEAGEASTYADSGTGAPIYHATSDPTVVDSDGDGLDDAVELNEGTEPRAADVDGDGLNDDAETDFGTDHYSGDSDGDDLTDGYEIDHIDDEGTHPLIFTEQISKWTYINQFTRGLICGDATFWKCGDFQDTIARLFGVIVRGFIPFSDATDLIANLIDAEFVGAGLSVVGLIPIVGDTGKAVAKIVEFGARYSNRVADLVRWAARADWLPTGARRAALDGLLGAARARLRNLGWSDSALDDLARGGDQEDQLRRATDAGLHQSDQVLGLRWYSNWRAAEADTVRALGGTPRQVAGRDPATGNVWRFHDGELPDGTRIEVKSGWRSQFNRNVDLCEQARRDRAMLDAGQIPAVVWHFVPSDNRVPHNVGMTADVLDCLTQHAIPFVIHHPG